METLSQPPINFKIPENITSVSQSVKTYIIARYKKHLWWMLVAIVIYEYLIYKVVISNPANDLAILFFAPALLAVFIYIDATTKVRHAFYQQFAQANNLSYSPTWGLINQTGAIFKVGHTKYIEDFINGLLNNQPIELFNYFYTVGSGKSARNFNKTIWVVDFSTPLPPVLFLYDFQSFGDAISDNNLNKVERIDLPEQIEKKYTLYCEKEFEIEALQIFTPDFMQSIYDQFPGFSLDLCGSKMYIYANSLITTEADLQQLKNFASFVMPRLDKILPPMKGSILAMTAALNSNQSFNTPYFLSRGSKSLVAILAVLLFCALLIYYVVKVMM